MNMYGFVKRFLDILMSLILLIVLSPLFLLLSILIRLDSKGPAIFVQKRIGHNKKEFNMFKFRTMIVGADKKKKDLMSLNEAHFPAFKMKNDPRLTRFGARLCPSGLDELPQLFNILMGEMSFIGFRPPLPEEVEHYKKWHMKRFVGVPGLLSTWVINGGHNLTFDEWIRLDIEYDKEKSLVLDFSILSKYLNKIFLKVIMKLNVKIFFKSLKFFRQHFRIFRKYCLLKKSLKNQKKNRTGRVIIFYVNYVKGMGHISRVIKLSDQICRNNPSDKVIVITDTKQLDKFNADCTIIKIPEKISYSKHDDSNPGLNYNSFLTATLREKIIFDTIRTYDPDMFFIDYRPKGFGEELTRSIKYLKGRSKIYLITRDIINDVASTKSSWSKQKYVEFLKRYYSGLIIFGDKNLFDLEKMYGFKEIKDKMIYLGYLVDSKRYSVSKKRNVLILVGSGNVGYDTARKVLENLSFLKKDASERIKVIVGPGMSNSRHDDLVKKNPSVEFLRYVPDVPGEIKNASLIITMGGYNTCTEIMESDVPTVVIPYEEKDSGEQFVRAELFNELGLYSYVPIDEITEETLLVAINKAKRYARSRKKVLQEIRLDGYDNFLRFVNSKKNQK